MNATKLFFWPMLLSAWAVSAADPTPPEPIAPVPSALSSDGTIGTNTPAPPVIEQPAATNDLASISSARENSISVTDTNLLRLNFRGAPLEMVLDYLSEAAGFIINLHASPRGRVDVWSNTPVTREEALSILDSVLRKNGYAAIRNGRTLTIVNRDEAKIYDIPVKLGSNPASIPRNDEIVTQIIPVRFVEVAQLSKDLQPLVSSQTIMAANEAGNSIVITDSQANIHRIAEIIQAIDMGAEDVTEVRVFHLDNSDPTEVSDLLTSLFPDESRGSSGSQSPVQFGGFRGMFGRPSSTSSSASTGNQSQRIKKRSRVLAVPDPRTSSVVVSAAKDLMSQIEAVVQELDGSKARKQSVHVYQLQNADPQEVQQVLQDMFERNSTTGSRNQSQNSSTLSNRRTSQSNQSSTSRTQSSQSQNSR